MAKKRRFKGGEIPTSSMADIAFLLLIFFLVTTTSVNEQKNAGLTTLTEKEQNDFNELNFNYKKKFNFPFIVAVKRKNKSQILRQFKMRLNNSKQVEFNTACNEVEKIASFRIQEIFNL